jgi:hypothetical protein
MVHTEQWNLRDALLVERGYKSVDEYRKSPHYKELRAKLVDPFAPCFCCGEITQVPSLHHRTYTNIGRETAEDFVQLCPECHDELHELVKRGTLSLASAHLGLRFRNIAEGEFGQQPGKVPKELWLQACSKARELKLVD